MMNRQANPPHPSPEITAILAPSVSHILGRAGSRGLEAIAVLGSAARGEETWRQGRLVGDVDLAAIVRSPDPWTARRFEEAAKGLPAGVHLGAIWNYRLSTYRTLYLYEARQSAHILWGTETVFERVRMKEPSDIPAWEGIRLLLNRMMECLVPRLRDAPIWYTAVKTYLAIAEAELIFEGRYASSYRARWEQVQSQGVVLGSTELFDHVAWATRIKLNESASIGCIRAAEHERWLEFGLESLVSRFVGRTVDLEEGIQIIGSQTVNYIHRLAHLRHFAVRPAAWTHILGVDPIIPVWQRGAALLRNRTSVDEHEIAAILDRWKRTYQPLAR